MTTVDTPVVQQPRGGKRGALLAVMLLVGLAIVLAGVFPFRQLIAQQRYVDNTQAKLDALVAENEHCRVRSMRCSPRRKLERIAREQYGMARPGETTYIVELEGGPSSEGVTPVESDFDSRSLLQRFWDFLTGRDLVPNE